MAAVTALVATGCSSGGSSQAGDTSSPSPSATAVTARPSVGARPVDPAVTAAYAALTSSLSTLAKDVPAMSSMAQFRTQLAAMNAALGTARNGLAAERAVRYPKPNCPAVRAQASVVYGAGAQVLAAQGQVAARAGAVSTASQRVTADLALVSSKAAALTAALKASGSPPPPALAAVNVAALVNNAKAAQAAAASASATAQSTAAGGAANAASLNAKASGLASGC